MRNIFKQIILYAFMAFIAIPVLAQESHQTFFSQLEHHIVAGFNIGATAPISLPAEIRKINAYWPQFTPQLGYNVTYRFKDNKWGIGSGILLDYKGMGAKASVKSLYTSINVSSEEGSENFEGNFTGDNKTEVKSAYVTIPLYVSYKISDKWNVRLGGYAAYLFSSEFKGEVRDGYIRVGSPIGDRIEIPYADFSFGKEMNTFDFGLTGGATYSINRKFAVFANLSWGLRPIFPSSFKGLEYKMYNVYGTLGLSYTL